MFVLNNDGKKQFDRLIKNLKFPIDIIPFLNKGSDLPLNIDYDIICLILVERGKGGKCKPFDTFKCMLQLIHESDGWEKDVWNVVKKLVYDFLIVTCALVFIYQVIEELPNQKGYVLHL